MNLDIKNTLKEEIAAPLVALQPNQGQVIDRGNSLRERLEQLQIQPNEAQQLRQSSMQDMGMFHPKRGESDSDPNPSHITVSQFEVEAVGPAQNGFKTGTHLQPKPGQSETRLKSYTQKNLMNGNSSGGCLNVNSSGLNLNNPSGLMSSQWSRSQLRGTQHQPQVVISVKCSKAMTVQNYNTLAKMVSKQRRSIKQTDNEADPNHESNSKSFHSKQKMLEARIEKLRSIENKIQSDTVCSKKNCPVSVDPRTTQERYRNETIVSTSEAKEMQGRIDRFRSTQQYKHSQSVQKLRHNSTQLDQTKEGLFKLNAEDRDIKISAADEVNFNFMRRHQVVEEQADINLSLLMKQNQERAVRNMVKSREKMRRKMSNKTMSNQGGGATTVYGAPHQQSHSQMRNTNNVQFKSHNVLRTPTEQGTMNGMSKTFATNMTTPLSRNQGVGVAQTAKFFGKQSTSVFTKSDRRQGAATPSGVGSRRYLNPSNQQSRAQYSSQLSKYHGGDRISKVASLETLKRAYEDLARSQSPELEKKDEFMATSLWRVAAKSNQEDFKEMFKNREQLDTSDDIELKLRELINTHKHRPAMEPNKQVSPRTIKFLCNMIMEEGGASQQNHQGTRQNNIETASAAVNTSRWPRTTGYGNQSQVSQPQTSMKHHQRNSNHRGLADPEEFYDPDGKTAEVCRPLLKDQKAKLVEILSKNEERGAGSSRGNAETFSYSDKRNDVLAQFAKQSTKIQKSVAELMKLQEEHNASPTHKARPKVTTKNEILELVSKQFPAGISKQATMFGRAMDLYNTHKERKGFSPGLIFKPETMSHFHIEAFGDNIEANRYQNEMQPKTLNLGNSNRDLLKQAVPQQQSFKHIPVMKKDMYRSHLDLEQIEEVKKESGSLKISLLPKTGTQVNILTVARQQEQESTQREVDDSPDSVFSSHLDEFANMQQLLAQSPTVPRKGLSRRLSNFNKINTQKDDEKQPPKKQKLSVLMTKEMPFDLDYYTKMDLSMLAKMDRQTAIMAYKTLKIALNPVFSGALDHRINMLDPKKALSLLELGTDRVKQQIGSGVELLQELKCRMDQLSEKQIFHGYWDCLQETSGCLPEARKGTSINIIKNQLYVFGGFARNTFNDLKIFDMTMNRWEEAKTEASRVIPDPRVSHTMTSYNDKLILFGGAGAYLKNLHMMPSYNDIWELDTRSQTWTKLEGSGIPPKKRMNHVSTMLGSLMLIHGGYSTEGRIQLDDFNLFDVEEQKWIKARVIMNGKVIESDAQYGSTIDTDDDDAQRLHTIGSRMGHCITTVFPHTSDRYSTTGPKGQYTASFGQLKKDIFKRGMWIHERVFSKEEIAKGRDFKEGFYIFGGHNREGESLNDLWLIRPEYYTNKRVIEDVKYQYTSKDSELTLNVQQISNFSGQPPCPRTGAAMIHINLKKQGHQILIIYGGRNDSIFGQTGSVALNDICIFNLNLMQWEALAMFGQLPMARWKHAMVAYYDEQVGSNGLMIFGGTNLHCYCKSKIYTFTLENKKRNNKQKTAVAQDKQMLPTPEYLDNNNLATGQSVHWQRKASSSRHASVKQKDDNLRSSLKNSSTAYLGGKFSEGGGAFEQQSLAIGKEITESPRGEAGRLRLGGHYASLQMAIMQRVDLLKEYIMRPKRQEKSSDKKFKQRQP